MIRKLVVANRGEIAVRIMRTAKAMGIRTVALATEVDAHALHATLADETVNLGEPTGYLDIPRVVAAAVECGADAIHPGYGFLSERAEFVEACEAAGIVFIGPPASAMRKLGSKIDAKRLAVASGVPVTPGHFEPGATASELRAAADRMGYPVMLKASAGGGGRGMRAVYSADDFDSALDLASTEAMNAFGDGAMMVEKLVQRPRHIEAQFIADAHGNVAVLFERECSIQRRHQKLIEECPSPVMVADPTKWGPMRDAVAKLALAAGYVGAGTTEFIYDEASGEFYFLEVNARLQVEHPVTEAVTGLDLVRWQIRVAQGEALDLSAGLMSADRSEIRGCAIEARIVAEDPARDFMPSTGQILAWAEPRGPGVRVDTGYGPGGVVSQHYDSLLAKLIVSGATREEVLQRLEQALQDFHILGVRTNIGYLLDVIRHPEFRAGRFDTGFLGREFSEWAPSAEIAPELAAVYAAASTVSATRNGKAARHASAWEAADAFRVMKNAN